MLIKSNPHNLRYITLRLPFTTFPSYFFCQPENVFGLTTYLCRPKHLKKGKHFRETHLRQNKRAVRFGTLGLYPVYNFSSNNPPFPPHPWRTTQSTQTTTKIQTTKITTIDESLSLQPDPTEIKNHSRLILIGKANLR
jgi:hypothetical protein